MTLPFLSSPSSSAQAPCVALSQAVGEAGIRDPPGGIDLALAQWAALGRSRFIFAENQLTLCIADCGVRWRHVLVLRPGQPPGGGKPWEPHP